MTSSFENKLVPYIKARYSIIWINTYEEARAEALIKDALTQCAEDGRLDMFAWSISEGMTHEVYRTPIKFTREETTDPAGALEKIHNEIKTEAIFVFKDLHPHMENPMVRRILRDISRDFKLGETAEGKAVRRTLILIGPDATLPNDLSHEVTMINLDLPDESEIKAFLEKHASKKETVETLGGKEVFPQIVDACKGLTSAEIADTLAKSIIERRNKIDSLSVPEMIMQSKADIIRKTGILEYYPAQVQMSSVGGLTNLKQWITIRQDAFSEEAKRFGLTSPRGILLAGVPGCGKSLVAKAISCLQKTPLIRFDIGKVFAGLVGQSEANMRKAIQTAETIGRCVLWIDEIDKAFAGMMSNSSGDSGVSQRVFGNFITWMQEKKAPVFIIATANRIQGLPPELMRKGRFDEIFFVNLPTKQERLEIFSIHIAKKRPKIKLNLNEVVEITSDYSGAEIEEIVNSALYQAFFDKKELNEQYLLTAAKNTRPLSRTRSAEIKDMVAWAKDNAVNASLEPNRQDVVLNKGSRLDL